MRISQVLLLFNSFKPCTKKSRSRPKGAPTRAKKGRLRLRNTGKMLIGGGKITISALARIWIRMNSIHNHIAKFFV